MRGAPSIIKDRVGILHKEMSRYNNYITCTFDNLHFGLLTFRNSIVY